MGFAAPASALLSDDSTLIEGAKLCTRYLPRHEREYGIPVHLLAAIASTESGRFNHALGINLPWPWTINVEGKGYFFDTKEQAIAAVQQFQQRGYQSIDVGCMQVNLHHHPNAFASLEEAFEPAYNVAYAAQFLKQNFLEEGSWRKATADYHSHTLIYGEPYAQMVYGAWNRIINKVAQARSGQPMLVASNDAPVERYHDQAAAQAASNVMRRPHNTHSYSYHAPRMHSISVASDTTRERGVLVVRPDYASASANQEAKLDDQFVTRPHAHEQSAAELGSLAPASGTAAAAENPPETKGAQIVRVSSGSASAKGQFQPQSHIIRVSDTATASAASGSSAEPGKNIFVFDN